ncbi:hypothetical protein C8Q77DRAFT_711711 [Trametes polyzona]|nr:hypothetical protein C8Q77DRAFT_711711 [Trametes polyzona]
MHHNTYNTSNGAARNLSNLARAVLAEQGHYEYDNDGSYGAALGEQHHGAGEDGKGSYTEDIVGGGEVDFVEFLNKTRKPVVIQDLSLPWANPCQIEDGKKVEIPPDFLQKIKLEPAQSIRFGEGHYTIRNAAPPGSQPMWGIGDEGAYGGGYDIRDPKFAQARAKMGRQIYWDCPWGSSSGRGWEQSGQDYHQARRFGDSGHGWQEDGGSGSGQGGGALGERNFRVFSVGGEDGAKFGDARVFMAHQDVGWVYAGMQKQSSDEVKWIGCDDSKEKVYVDVDVDKDTQERKYTFTIRD